MYIHHCMSPTDPIVSTYPTPKVPSHRRGQLRRCSAQEGLIAKGKKNNNTSSFPWWAFSFDSPKNYCIWWLSVIIIGFPGKKNKKLLGLPWGGQLLLTENLSTLVSQENKQVQQNWSFRVKVCYCNLVLLLANTPVSPTCPGSLVYSMAAKNRMKKRMTHY